MSRAFNRCIVDVAAGSPHYLNWQKQLIHSLAGFAVPCLAWTDLLPPDSPEHRVVPYAFKPYAFAAAAEAGYDSIIWCDSSVWARKNPAPIFEIVEEAGHCFFQNGWTCGQWSTDACLKQHGVTRDAAMQIPDFTGSCMGLNLRHARSSQFLSKWRAAADDGVSFLGDWNNDNGQCSQDSRCLGHRHDQVVGSMIADCLDMELTSNHRQLFSYYKPDLDEATIFVNGGGP